MASPTKDVAVDMSPYFLLFTDGTIQRLLPSIVIPPSDTPVRSKDVVIDPVTGVSVRIFMPRHQAPPHKLPLVVYIHGGAFCIGSASAPPFHKFIADLVEKGNLIAVSVDYRLAPENPLPIPFDDSWTAFQWIAAHAGGGGADPWLNEYADFRRVFVGGESAGATIANDVAIRAGVDRSLSPGVEILGLFFVHPFFGNNKEDKLYKVLCPTSSGKDDDPRLNPAVDPRIRQMAGRRVIFFVAEKDFLRDRGRAYYEGLNKSEWSGEVEIMESEGEVHCFHLLNPNTDKAAAITNRLLAFFNNLKAGFLPGRRQRRRQHRHNTLVRAKSDGGFGPDDPRLHPMAHPDLMSGLGCTRVLVCVAGDDFLKTRGLTYHQSLSSSHWNGVVEIFESPREPHVFHLFNPTCDNATTLMTRIVDFLHAAASGATT